VSEKVGWDLRERGLLWKEVVKSAINQQSFGKLAEEFVKELQGAKRPQNAFEGLLLDRMAATHLRKVLLLEEQAAYQEHHRAAIIARNKWTTPAEEEHVILLNTSPSTQYYLDFEVVLQYEASLDREFHRNTILLMQLQQLSERSAMSTLPKSSSKTIEGHAKEAEAE
jgi:hypothetical protein